MRMMQTSLMYSSQIPSLLRIAARVTTCNKRRTGFLF